MEKSIRLLNAFIGLVIIGFLVNMITALKFSNLQDISITKPKSYVSVKDVDKTLDCLAMNIYKEAGAEPFEGKVAVAQVTLNRVDHPKFPNDVCSVVYEKNIIMEKVVCQFSWYCMDNNTTRPNNDNFKESYAVAKKVLLEGFRLDGLNDALYFHSVRINPSWPHQKIATIGNHIFYRSKK